ncbi:tripartite tricarboxylate transporter TctB family protein [Salinicola sp. CR57]|uniref:tripartite tricarboxylate transporter TctB family protein n=1 Tax=Salinicola sp. CR57 TaxID=1949086 RepID=UPI001300A268|nr:tripartite tricarboxylate transporter TctB family protein [Salinicola sp. CR57]
MNSRFEGRSSSGSSGVSIALGLATVVLAAGALWFARDMSMLAAIFPRTISVLLLIFGCGLVVQAMRGRERVSPQAPGHWGRQLALVVIVLAWSLALKWLGFLGSSVLACMLLMGIAHFHAWSARRVVVYLVTLLLIIAGFYGLFAGLLNVPLPRGRFWS